MSGGDTKGTKCVKKDKEGGTKDWRKDLEELQEGEHPEPFGKDFGDFLGRLRPGEWSHIGRVVPGPREVPGRDPVCTVISDLLHDGRRRSVSPVQRSGGTVRLRGPTS